MISQSHRRLRAVTWARLFRQADTVQPLDRVSDGRSNFKPLIVPPGGAAAGEGISEMLEGRFPSGGSGLRERAAKGALVNAVFQVGLVTIGLVKGLVVAAFLTPGEYGVWGILVISLITITWLKQVGAGDKFIQQSDQDQERAFQQAFTVELLFTLAFTLLLCALIPIIALIYGEPRLLAPGLILALTMPLAALQAPIWVLYRRMDFARQRILQAVDPVVALGVTVTLAATGAGYWSLVAGSVAGLITGALIAILSAEYRLALRFDPGVVRSYLSFSWPLVVSGAGSLVVAQGSMILGEAKLGLAGAGMISFASTIAFYSTQVDTVLTQTLYPAICAVRDRTDLLFETFETSNRLALMWGVPFGLGLALFAPDFVHLVVGDEWTPAVFMLQVFGVAMGIGHIGHNWDAFYRARGDTRPIALWSTISMLAFLAFAVPLLILEGLDGYAIGMGLMALVSLLVRGLYLTKLFSGLRAWRYLLRALAPSVPAAATVLLLRAAEGAERDPALVVGEVLLYLGVTALSTLWLERRLLSQLWSYLRGGPRPSPTPAV